MKRFVGKPLYGGYNPVRKGRILKTTLCVVALSFSLSLGVNAKAKVTISDVGMAGISPAYDKYFEVTKDEGTGEAEKLLNLYATQSGVPSARNVMTEVVSPYENLGISIANDYVNIRSEANTESEVVGKLYRGTATDIIEYEGEWAKIHSGKVDGYIKTEYLAIGTEAEALVEEFADKYATIKTETLFVREEQSTESKITTMVPLGEQFYIIKEYDGWVEIMIDQEETGFVSKDYIDIEVRFKYAISIEEEQAKLKLEEEARLAEIERLEKLAKQQEEERKAEAARKAAAEQKAQSSSNSNSSSSSSSSSNSSSSNSSSSNSSSSNSSSSNSSSNTSKGTGQEIANYAVKFVGNPYVWGGTSLTNGADCSGFIQSIYAHFGYSIPRVSGDQAHSAGREVSINDLQPGDIISYRNNSGTVNHVALYIGNGKIVHASNAREGIKISNYNYRTPYKVRRVI